MGVVALQLVVLADHGGVNLPGALIAKIEHNARKYPADQVSGLGKMSAPRG
jgi:hypothetical protein